MAISREPISFDIDGATHEGMYVSVGGGAKPCVAVMHHWAGRAEDMIEMAERMTDWGYNGFACDLYGGARTGSNPDENREMMGPLVGDRALLEKRMLANLQAAAGHAGTAAGRMAAIGFCFGGLCVLDLARANAPVLGVASFHGLLKPRPDGGTDAIKPKVAIHHGWDDPMAPPEEVVAIGKELTDRKADWQFHAYGGAMHAFTTAHANMPDHGLQYNASAHRRSWASLKDFLAEVFG